MGKTELLQPETERLRLRQWTEADYPPFAEMNADPEVMRFLPAPLSRTESDAMANRCRILIDERGWGFWAVERRGTGTFVGLVGLHVPDVALPFSPCVEIGWRLARPHWGKGYATEAAQAALQVAFETLGLGEVVSFTALPNLRSQAVMRRIGMNRSPANFEHPLVPCGSPLRPHCLYRLSQEEWRDAGKGGTTKKPA